MPRKLIFDLINGTLLLVLFMGFLFLFIKEIKNQNAYFEQMDQDSKNMINNDYCVKYWSEARVGNIPVKCISVFK